MSDALVAAIAAGDTQAFADWMRGAERPLRDSLRRFASAVDTESVLQETLLRVWQVAPRFDSDGKPNALLRFGVRIAHNLAVSEIRKTGRVALVDEADLERNLAEAMETQGAAPSDPLLRRIVAKCRARLPAKPLAALTARLASSGGQPDASLAARLAMTKNTFLQNFSRARKLLAQCLQKNGVDLSQELT